MPSLSPCPRLTAPCHSSSPCALRVRSSSSMVSGASGGLRGEGGDGGSTQKGGDAVGGGAAPQKGDGAIGGAAPTRGVLCHSPAREEVPRKGQVGSVLERSTELPRSVWGKMGVRGGWEEGTPPAFWGEKGEIRAGTHRQPHCPPASPAPALPAPSLQEKRGGKAGHVFPHHVPRGLQLFPGIPKYSPRVYPQPCP